MNLPGFTADGALNGNTRSYLVNLQSEYSKGINELLLQAGDDIINIDELVRRLRLTEEGREQLHRALEKLKEKGQTVGWDVAEHEAETIAKTGGKFVHGGGGKQRDYRKANPRRGGKQRGAARVGVLMKVVSLVGLAACEVECAKTYNACLEKADRDQDSCFRSCSGFQKYGKFDEYNDCVDNCTWTAELDMGICATKYAICGLSCLVPFSFW